MSLEQAITENTAAIRDLIVALRTPDADIAAVAQHLSEAKPESETTAAPAEDKAAAKKSQKAPASEPTQTASDNSVSSSSESQQAEKQGGVEYKQIQQLVPKIAKTPDGTAMVVALFGRYGVKRGPELNADQYDDFYADLLKVEAGELDPRLAEVA